MISRKIKITSSIGIHLRPAGMLCDQASKYRSEITINRGDKRVNAKSLLNVLSACIRYGDDIEIVCEGEDELIAMQGMIDLIGQKINCM